MKYLATVEVTLRPSVLDPAGVAVAQGLTQMGYPVAAVRVGKLIRLEVDAQDEAAAQILVQQMGEQVLSNPVIENFRVALTPL
ncbi:phosphoribosylformylglycinamidine synthase subunit PurS [Candidatus Cyanaurora vandensis]|uniref:phosphoribosylformylglycinamidine synthase subunit PurS n=1 Tax=Candidatus Cyanaurora vandensis TaxID=2714958 RepID=UPI00257FAAF4|nr:phosphoribosylformylglycinamidine synthase subunit PurS [Candidatus Cyanaurora vandensis]